MWQDLYNILYVFQIHWILVFESWPPSINLWVFLGYIPDGEGEIKSVTYKCLYLRLVTFHDLLLPQAPSEIVEGGYFLWKEKTKTKCHHMSAGLKMLAKRLTCRVLYTTDRLTDWLTDRYLIENYYPSACNEYWHNRLKKHLLFIWRILRVLIVVQIHKNLSPKKGRINGFT